MLRVTPSNQSKQALRAAQADQAAESTGPKRSFRLPVALVAGGVMLAVLAVFWSSLEAGFVYDDLPRIVQAEGRLGSIWPPDWLFDGQRPVVQLSLVLNHMAGGMDPRGYHLFNLLVHVASTGLVCLVMLQGGRRLAERGVIGLGDRGLLAVAAAVALVWALHPVQTATATYVIQRAESLAASFSLLAILLLLGAGRRPGAWRNILILVSIVMALGSKPTAVVLPALLLLVDWSIVAGSWRVLLDRRRGLHVAAWSCLLVLMGTGAVQSLWRSEGLAGVGFDGVGTTPIAYAISQVSAAGVYARVLIDPAAMSIDHGVEALQPTWTSISGILIITTLLVLLVIAIVRRAWWVVIPGAVLLCMLPTSSVVPLVDPVADHRLHLALLPIVIGVVAVAARTLKALPAAGRPAGAGLAAVLLAAILVGEGLAVRHRNADYADPVRLWNTVAERRPRHVRGLVNRAAIALQDGRYEDASRDLSAAEVLQPTNPVVLVNLALVDLHDQKPESALRRLAVASSVRADDPVLHAARGDALRDLGRNAEAVTAYGDSLRIQPGDVVTRIAMGNALASIDRLDEAAIEFRLAASGASDSGVRASARFNEGNMLFILERMPEAITAYEAALAADPSHSEAAFWLEEARSHGR